MMDVSVKIVKATSKPQIRDFSSGTHHGLQLFLDRNGRVILPGGLCEVLTGVNPSNFADSLYLKPSRVQPLGDVAGVAHQSLAS